MVEERFCKICKIGIQGHRLTLYCPSCRQVRNHQIRKTYYWKNVEDRVCKMCGASLKGSRRLTYCPDCRLIRIRLGGYSWRRNNPEKVKAMKVLYTPRYKAHKREYDQKRYATHRDSVKIAVRAWQKANPDLRHTYRAQRKARLRGAQVERVYFRAIYERDKGICQVCKKPVRYHHKGPEQASLDHILPIAFGGHHVADNVQLTHLRCNIRRGAALLPAQMRFS